MDLYLIRSQRWAGALVLALVLEAFRCGMPTTSAAAAQFPPAIMITEGKTNQGLPYLFGGVSSDERNALEERAKGYNVKLIFAEKRGAFISGVAIVIANAKGAEIAALATNGPWFYIQLPPGDYAVRATFKGETKQIKDLKVVKDKKVQQGVVWDLGEPASKE